MYRRRLPSSFLATQCSTSLVPLMSSCSSSSDRNSSSSPVPSYSPSPKWNWHLKVLAQQFSPTLKTSKTVQSRPRWSWEIRTLGTAQQYLALVLGEYRMTSNQDERGFAAVTSTFFFFSPEHHAIQSTKSDLQRGGIEAPYGHGQSIRV